MNESDRDLRQLLDLALDKSVESRRALTATIGDLFSAKDRVLTERERALMGDILRKLIRDCESVVRRDLSERLARAPDPPHDLIVALANDDIEVAAPVLMNSSVLRDVELIQVIRQRTQQHQLAIAMRRSISEHVSDALVETGSTDVIKTLLENQDARISEATMIYLAEESRRVDTYQEPLIKRRDLKPELAERMYLWVSAALRQHILTSFDIHPTRLDDELEGVAAAISADPDQHREDPEAEQPAAVLARRLSETKQITPEFLIQVLRQGEIRLFEALFAELSGLRTPRLQTVLYDGGGENLAIACRALEMPKPTFATIFLLSRRGRPGQQVVEPRELSHALMLFDRTKPTAAREVLKSWRRNPKYQTAIERLGMDPDEPGEADGA
ncbi:MAG TPA: DUF2336 domain-containing protein [Kiloniellales bacterium]|nr:DUF2336 domain-containing protein [Kiloniellales bacterium]